MGFRKYTLTSMWKRLKTTVLYKHPRLTLVEDDIQLPNGRVLQYLKFIDGSDGVTIICINDNKLLVQKEYSYPPNKVLFQFPGGKTETGETLESAAKRELIEECGIAAVSLLPLGYFYTNNRRSKDKMHVFLASEVIEVPKKGGDPEESIESQWITLKEFKEMLSSGKIDNFSMLAAWALYTAKV